MKTLKNHTKKASSRLRLLEQMSYCLTSIAARLVYIAMNIPHSTSTCTLKLPCNNTQKLKYNSLGRRAPKIIKLNIPSIKNFANRERFLLVKKLLIQRTK